MSQAITYNNKHPKGLWYIIAVYMWEYFSFYGMRALLILYLTQELVFSDHYSYAVYGAFVALVYLTPILGGLLADKIMGFRNAVITGALLMSCGHLILGIDGKDLLFLGMAFIICGYGYFKSNVPCLLGQLYDDNDPKRDSAFTLLYLGGNIGSVFAPVACGVVASVYGWDYGFGLAGIGMLLGLTIFLFGRKHVPNIVPQQLKPFAKASVRNIFIFALTIAIIVTCYFAIEYQFEGYLLAVAVVFAVVWYLKIMIQTDAKSRRRLLLVVPFLLFGILFWVFDEQMFTSVELFIERNINTVAYGYNVPASVFTSINPFAVICGGLLLAWVWRHLKGFDNNFGRMIKFMMGFVLQLFSFVLLILAAKFATETGQASVVWVIIALFLLGLSELFIDPIALSEITSVGGTKHAGFLAATYFLFTGSIAGFLAAKFAQMATIQGIDQVTSLPQQAQLFFGLFWHIGSILLGMIVVWFVIALLLRKVK